MIKNKMKYALVTFGFVSLLSVSACGKKDNGATVDNANLVPTGKYEEEVSFTTGRRTYDTNDLPKGSTVNDNPVTRWIKDQTNIKVENAWESDEFDTKLSAAMSTGEIPDVLTTVNASQLQELIDSDMLADLTEIYDKVASDTLKARYDTYDGRALESAKRDGKLYALPQTAPYYEQSISWIRKDWLDKVKLPVPETVDELETALKAFVDNKLGGKDTIGAQLHPEIGGGYNKIMGMSPVVNQLNAYPRDWITKDGEAVYGSVQPEMKDALALLAKWYKDGIIDKNFITATWDSAQAALVSQVGYFSGPWWAVYMEGSYADPNAEWIAMEGPVKNKGDKFQTTMPAPASGFLVVSKKAKNPEAVLRAYNAELELVYGDSKEVEAFKEKEAKEAGLETLSIQWYQGAVSLNTEPADNNKVRGEMISKALKDKNPDSLPKGEVGIYNNVLKWEKDKDLAGLHDYLEYTQSLPKSIILDKMDTHSLAYYGKTASAQTKGANLEQLEIETFVKIIVGQEPIDAFDEFVKQWKSQGGDDITKEVNDEVKAGRTM